MGYPRKSAAIRLREGNPGHRPIPNELVGLGRPEAPATLTVEQKARWDEVLRALPDNLLTSADTSTVERMAVAWAMFREATAELNAGLVIDGVRSPWLSICRMATQEMDRCGANLGLSPHARTKLLEPPEQQDLLERLMVS